MIDRLLFADVAAVIGSAAPKFVNGPVERRRQGKRGHKLAQCWIGLTGDLARGCFECRHGMLNSAVDVRLRAARDVLQGLAHFIRCALRDRPVQTNGDFVSTPGKSPQTSVGYPTVPELPADALFHEEVVQPPLELAGASEAQSTSGSADTNSSERPASRDPLWY